MDLPVHDQILWQACLAARARLKAEERIADPVHYFPLLVRGSWFNDTCQVSPFTDLLTKPPPDPAKSYGFTPGDVSAAFFDAYWSQELDRVIARLGRYDGQAAVKASQLAIELQNAADFGQYLSHDHLDVLSEDAAVHEYGIAGPMAATVRESLNSVGGRFEFASIGKTPDVRMNPARVSSLGRGLHTVADFFAHTNYVELLLWALAEQGKLPKPIVGVLDCDPGSLPFDPAFFGAHPLDEGVKKKEHIFLYAPVTPPNGFDAEALKVPALWLGATAKVTPLASCVFDKSDTAYSMLKIFARYLESEKDGETTEQKLNFLFSIMDVSGTPLGAAPLRILAKLQDAISGVFDAAGRLMRNALAGYLEGKAEGGAANGDVYKLSAALIRKYEGAEANDWAQAGRLRYLAHSVHHGMGRTLAKQLADAPGKPRLPHHTLLSKDHPSARPDEQLRFALACTLATEVTTRLLMWHFAKPDPTADGWRAIRDGWLRHPSDQLGVFLAIDKARDHATRCLTPAWPALLDPKAPLDVLV